VFLLFEFGAGHFKEITCKVLRKSMNGKKVVQVVLVTLIAVISSIVCTFWF